MTTVEMTTEPAAVETRAAQVADVNYPKRVVTVVAMPYEQLTENVLHRGRVIGEIVTRGAFDGIERRTSQIKVNRDHSWQRPIGRIVGLHPSRKEGLVAELRISPTPLGEESLALAADDVLGASAGFELLRRDNGRGPVYEDAETWEQGRSVRRLNRLRLDHVALVPNPAYGGAQVLSVRAQEPISHAETVSGTPNLDRLAHEALLARFEELNRRWQH